jgi:hypothetical protein
MKRWLTAREVDSRDVRHVASFSDHTAQQFDRKKLGAVAVQIFFGAKAVAAMQVTDVSQFDTQALWAIVIAERGIGLH